MSSNPGNTPPVPPSGASTANPFTPVPLGSLDSNAFLVLFTRVAGAVLGVGLVAILVYALQDIHHFLSVATTAILIAAASLALGLLVGFIFGIPSAPKEETQTNLPAPAPGPAAVGGGQAPGAAPVGAGQPEPSPNLQPYRPNTNMEKISDWLATILVGIGLTQLLKVPAGLEAFGNKLKPALGNTDAAAWMAVGALLLYAIFGFLLAFLWTRVKIPELYALSDVRQQLLYALTQGKAIGVAEGLNQGISQGERQGIENAMKLVQPTATGVDLIPKAVAPPPAGEAGVSFEPVEAEALQPRHILWVDDQPDNNKGLRQLITARVNADFEICTTTAEALSKDISKFDLVISDMSRPEDRQAGMSLLQELVRQGFKKPYLIYAGRVEPWQEASVRRVGGTGITASPVQLLNMIESALKS